MNTPASTPKQEFIAHPVLNLLSDNFTLEEGTSSATATEHGIDNTPSIDTLEVMYKSATKLEKVRALLDKPIHVNSWYRCPELNTAVGSKNTSQHIKGEAIDFVSPAFGTPLDICNIIIANKDLIGFDQLILEHTWVHISFSILSGAPRGQVLSLLTGGKYAVGLTDADGKPY